MSVRDKPYYRGEDPRNRSTGLGLAIAQPRPNAMGPPLSLHDRSEGALMVQLTKGARAEAQG